MRLSFYPVKLKPQGTTVLKITYFLKRESLLPMAAEFLCDISLLVGNMNKILNNFGKDKFIIFLCVQ